VVERCSVCPKILDDESIDASILLKTRLIEVTRNLKSKTGKVIRHRNKAASENNHDYAHDDIQCTDE
jgi:hypothetical protein